MELQWPLILFTFFLCLCGGTMAMQGLLVLLGKGKDLQKPVLIISAVELVIGGISVFMHLHHWERIFNAFGALLLGNGTAVSGITLEFWGCVVFAIMLILYFLFIRRSADGMAPKWCAILAIVVGLALPIVTGTSYLMASIPAWNTPLLVLYYLCNAVLLGGISLAIVAYVKKDTDSGALSMRVSLVGIIASLVIVLIYAIFINTFGQFGTIDYYFDPVIPDTPMVDSAAVNGSVLAGSMAGLFWGLAIAVGLAVPLVLAIMDMRRHDGKVSLPLAVTSGVCAITGSLVWRGILYVVAVSIFALY